LSDAILPPLTARARLLLAGEVLSTYAQVRWRLSRGNVEDTVRALRGAASGGVWVDPSIESYWQAVRLAKATTRTLGIVPADTRCLMQSLVLLGLLSRRGIGSVLVVAVNSGAGFAAHAWVEHDERPLLPTGDFGRLVEI